MTDRNDYLEKFEQRARELGEEDLKRVRRRFGLVWAAYLEVFVLLGLSALLFDGYRDKAAGSNLLARTLRENPDLMSVVLPLFIVLAGSVLAAALVFKRQVILRGWLTPFCEVQAEMAERLLKSFGAEPLGRNLREVFVSVQRYLVGGLFAWAAYALLAFCGMFIYYVQDSEPLGLATISSCLYFLARSRPRPEECREVIRRYCGLVAVW